MRNFREKIINSLLIFGINDAAVYELRGKLRESQEYIKPTSLVLFSWLRSRVSFAHEKNSAEGNSEHKLRTPNRIVPVWPVLILVVLFALPFNDLALGLDHFSEGVAAANRGDFAKAAELFTMAIKKEPSFYAAYANRGSVLIKSGHILRGIEDWHKARDLAPPFGFALFTGDILQRTTGTNDILNFVLQTELDPDFIPSVVMTGAAYTDLGHVKSAVVLFRKSMDLTRNPLWKVYFEYWAKSLEDSPKE